MGKYVTFYKLKRYYDIRSETAKKWALGGQIKYKTIQNKHHKTWLYDVDSVGNMFENEGKNNEEGQGETVQKAKIIYARVSSKKQETDLQRQIELLRDAFPKHELVKDIGSGINFKTRRGFSSLVERVCNGEVSEIVVTYKDRLCRFAYDLFQQVCVEHHCKIVVYSAPDTSTWSGETEELKDDLLSVVNFFVAKRNGKRSGELKRRRQCAKRKKREEESSECDEEDSPVPNKRAKITAHETL